MSKIKERDILEMPDGSRHLVVGIQQGYYGSGVQTEDRIELTGMRKRRLLQTVRIPEGTELELIGIFEDEYEALMNENEQST